MKIRALVAPVLRGRRTAFTMIEIAISLAVIGFALVAIIGVLPLGMEVQKENREETIINQDATMFMEAIRNGSQGMDDLTNYVYAITNYVTEYHTAGRSLTQVRGYWPGGSTTTPPYALTNGARIIGLLSTPRYIPFASGKDTGFVSNYVVGYVRAMSGSAADKFPQTNQSLRELAFSYRLLPEIVPYAAYDLSWVNYNDPAIRGDTNAIIARSNTWIHVRNLQTNMHDIRPLFRWPVLANGKSGKGPQIYRTIATGALAATNDLGFASRLEYLLYFLLPRTFVKAP